MTMIRLLLSLALCCSLSAATYYVRKDGNDSNAGTADNAGGAWLTVGKAASVVNPGDTVYVRQGTYAENVTFTRPGTAVARINWYGERQADGTRLTILDASAALTGWVAAPEIGAGVYKRTGLAQRPGAMIGDGRLVTEYREWAERGSPYNVATWLEPDSKPLAAPTDAENRQGYPNYYGSFWDPVEAFWAWDGTTAHMRFRDGSDPDAHNIRVHYSGNGSTSDEIVTAAPVLVTGASYNSWNGFEIRNAFAPVAILPPVGASVVGATFTSNYVHTANACITAGLGSATGYGTVSDIRVEHNVISQNWYAIDAFGPWWSGINHAWPEWGAYQWSKYYVSVSSSETGSVSLWNMNGDPAIVGNIFTNSGAPIKFYNFYRYADTLTVASNVVHDAQQGMVIGYGNGIGSAYLHDNLVTQTHIAFRMHGLNAEPARGTLGPWYVYRNRAWNPWARGQFMYFYKYPNGSIDKTVRVYHNSYSGGLVPAVESTFALPNLGFWNNVLDTDGDPIRTVTGGAAWHNNKYRVVEADWTGTGNIVSSAYEWPGASSNRPSDSAPDFLIDETSALWNSGYNLTGFGWPDSVSSADSGAWDIGWHEFGGEEEPEPPPTPPVSITSPPADSGTPNFYENGSATRTVRVTRFGSNVGDLTGNWSWSGTAEYGTHYTLATGNTSTWTIPNGQYYVEHALTPIDDGAYTGDLTIVVTITSGAGYTVSSPSSVTIYRRDAQVAPTALNPLAPGQFVNPQRR